MICGIVDVGSNTMRLSIYRCGKGKAQLLLNRKVMAGLASYAPGGMLSAEGIRLVCRVIKDFRKLLDNLEIAPMHVFATASLRNVSNTEEVVAEILAKTGQNVDVVSGREEAELSFRGALTDTPLASGLMVDVGGGSTELLRFVEHEITGACSLPIGALNLFNRFVERLHPTKAERKAIRREVKDQYAAARVDMPPSAHICGVGGTIRAACKIANRLFERPDDCRVLTAAELKELIKTFKKPTQETTRLLLKLAPDRIHTLIPGLLVLDTVRGICGAEDVTASVCGVREGYLHRRVLGE